MALETGRAVWRVLVVDDEENLNWSLVTSLRKDGYHADGARTGEEARRRLSETHYDCVISDVKMPGMDGFELLHWLRSERPTTRVVMMTAFGSPTAREEAFRGGVVAYLEKPFDLVVLKDQLRKLADGDGGGPAAADGYDLLEVARVIHLARRDIALVIHSGGHTGRLRFARGELVWAEAGSYAGDEAFLALTVPRGARVQPEPWDGRAQRNVAAPLSQLIYQALAMREGRGTGSLRSATVESPVDVAASRPSPVPVDSGDLDQQPTVAIATPSRPPMSTSPAPEDAVAAMLERLIASFPTPCGAAVLRLDGAVVAQRWHEQPAVPSGSYVHLMSAVQAAARALLLADLGILDDVRIRATEQVLVLRRLAQADRAAVLVVSVPLDADLAALTERLRAESGALVGALR